MLGSALGFLQLAFGLVRHVERCVKPVSHRWAYVGKLKNPMET